MCYLFNNIAVLLYSQIVRMSILNIFKFDKRSQAKLDLYVKRKKSKPYIKFVKHYFESLFICFFLKSFYIIEKSVHPYFMTGIRFYRAEKIKQNNR